MTDPLLPKDELASDRATDPPDIEALKRVHRAQLDVMQAALNAAISTAQFQAVTNRELNEALDKVIQLSTSNIDLRNQMATLERSNKRLREKLDRRSH